MIHQLYPHIRLPHQYSLLLNSLILGILYIQSLLPLHTEPTPLQLPWLMKLGNCPPFPGCPLDFQTLEPFLLTSPTWKGQIHPPILHLLTLSLDNSLFKVYNIPNESQFKLCSPTCLLHTPPGPSTTHPINMNTFLVLPPHLTTFITHGKTWQKWK